MMTYRACIYHTNIPICKLTYIEYSEIDFKYVFEPIYSNLDKLDNFRGIQGIDLSLRKTMYIRKNQMPNFIFEHNILSGKKNFYVSKHIDGMCLLEFLANSNNQYFGDKMYIRPYEK